VLAEGLAVERRTLEDVFLSLTAARAEPLTTAGSDPA
jgi:hypothetical protein